MASRISKSVTTQYLNRLLITKQAQSWKPQMWKSCNKRAYSTPTSSAATSTSLLSRLRDDLKTAMRARDTARLSVLRSLLAEITNASKTTSPISTDLALLALLRRQTSSCKQSIQEFCEADRKDLVAKEEEQLRVLEEYGKSVHVIGEKEVMTEVKTVVDSVRSDGRQLTMGELMKRCIGPGGVFDGKPVEKSVVAKAVKDAVAATTS